MSERRWAVLSKKVIGRQDNPMLIRWRLLQTPCFGIYVHFIHREDLDRMPHDHPWWFASLLLRGGYEEEFWPDARAAAEKPRHRTFGKVNFYRGGHWMGAVLGRSWHRWIPHTFPMRAAHRIVNVEPGTVTLVVVGPKIRTWGFYDAEGAFIDWRDYHQVPARSRSQHHPGAMA